MQGDSFGSNRSRRVPPTVPQAKNSTSGAQRGAADMRDVRRLVRVEDHVLHVHTALALLVQRECRDVDDLGDETPGAVARRGSSGQWWLR